MHPRQHALAAGLILLIGIVGLILDRVFDMAAHKAAFEA